MLYYVRLEKDSNRNYYISESETFEDEGAFLNFYNCHFDENCGSYDEAYERLGGQAELADVFTDIKSRDKFISDYLTQNDIELITREEFKRFEDAHKADYINDIAGQHTGRYFLEYRGNDEWYDIDSDSIVDDWLDYADMLNTEATDLQDKLFKPAFKALFDNLLSERGVKKTFLAEKLGYRQQSDLTRKIERDSFSRQELGIIAKALKLTKTELYDLVQA